MIKLLLIITLLAGTFLGGYYLGQQPDNPNISGLVEQGRRMVCGTGDRAAETPQPAAEHVGDYDPAFRVAK